jgi:hypothetical protein
MTTPKKFVFVLMPFTDAFNDIYAYGIKQTCTEMNVYCERVDEQIFSERILDRIYNQIAKADLIIADMTGRNANVFYEVGYAHGIGKDVILLTQNADDIPFDLKHFPHIIYNGEIKTLSAGLKTRVEWFLSEGPEFENIDLDFGLEFLFEGTKIEEGTEILLRDFGTFEELQNLKIDIYNSSNKIFKSKFSVGLEVDSKYENYFILANFIKPSMDKLLVRTEPISEIYPKSFENIEFVFNKLTSEEKKPSEIDATLKIFTNLELREINFKLIVENNSSPSVW